MPEKCQFDHKPIQVCADYCDEFKQCIEDGVGMEAFKAAVEKQEARIRQMNRVRD